MEATDEQQEFLAALVKGSRQRPLSVAWRDRDGQDRITVLSPADDARLGAIAHAQRISKSEVLRRAAHVPRQRPPSAQAPADSA